MNAALLVLCAAGAALVSYTTSGLVSFWLSRSQGWLQRRSPAARARVLLALALLPALATLAVMGAALAPTFGWIADHCHAAGDPHSHPHICGHYEETLPALPVVLLGLFFALRVLTGSTRMGWLSLSSWRTSNRLLGEAERTSPKGLHILPLGAPQAFVIGTLWPRLFVTSGLLSPENRIHLASVLAHERAHLSRADAVRRLVANWAAAFHLPGVAQSISGELGRAHEMAADEAAALQVGSRKKVARALLHLCRAQARLSDTALAFGETDIELRVVALLRSPLDNEGPSAGMLLLSSCVAIALLLVSAEAVHHGLEVVLGFLG